MINLVGCKYENQAGNQERWEIWAFFDINLKNYEGKITGLIVINNWDVNNSILAAVLYKQR